MRTNIWVPLLKETAKNGIFFSGPTTKALPPSRFFLELFSDQALLVAGPLKKDRFLRLS